MNRLKIVGGLIVIFLVGPLRPAAAEDALVWQTPYGTFGLPFQATEALLGFDAILRQSIGGFSLPVYTDPKGIIAFQLGGVAAWPNNGATFEPYIAAGHDFAKEIPALAKYQSVHLNVFGRYASEKGKAGLGVSISYAPGTPMPVQSPVVPVEPTPTSRLNLYQSVTGA